MPALKIVSACGDQLRSPLLLVLRLYWGCQCVLTGWGKLTHLGRTAGYFDSLGLPLPTFNAAAAGTTELLAGLLLALGLFSRLAAVPLIVVMLVAYATAERAALLGLFANPDGFTSATPFLFLLTFLIVLAFGPGALSLDTWIARRSSPTPARAG